MLKFSAYVFNFNCIRFDQLIQQSVLQEIGFLPDQFDEKRQHLNFKFTLSKTTANTGVLLLPKPLSGCSPCLQLFNH